MILAGSFAIIIFFAAGVWWLFSPSWVALFPQPVPESAQQSVLFLLSKHNIDYKVDSAKNIILVELSARKKAQLMLAENGQPEKLSAGLEVFNSSDYGLSEFAQNVNYQRGMEEELSRTLKKLQGVKDARIHLTIKKDSLFEDRKQPPKATVVIKPISGVRFTTESVHGMQQIVAAAVPNLDPSQVVIVTDAGEVLSSSGTDSTGQEASGLEEKYTQRIVNLLQGVLAEGGYKISVNVVMDYKKKTTVEENYFPDANTGKGFLAKRKISDKSTADNTQSSSPQLNKNNEEEYLFSRERSEIVYPEAELVKITVGLVINRSMTDVERDNLIKLIFTSLGMIESRGDKISLFVAPKIQVKSDANLTVDLSASKSIEGNKIQSLSSIDSFVIKYKFVLVSVISVLIISMLLLLFLVYRSSKSRTTHLTEFELKKLSNDLKLWSSQS